MTGETSSLFNYPLPRFRLINQRSYSDVSDHRILYTMAIWCQLGHYLRNLLDVRSTHLSIKPKRYIQTRLAIDQQKDQEKRMTASAGGLGPQSQTRTKRNPASDSRCRDQRTKIDSLKPVREPPTIRACPGNQSSLDTRRR